MKNSNRVVITSAASYYKGRKDEGGVVVLVGGRPTHFSGPDALKRAERMAEHHKSLNRERAKAIRRKAKRLKEIPR